MSFHCPLLQKQTNQAFPSFTGYVVAVDQGEEQREGKFAAGFFERVSFFFSLFSLSLPFFSFRHPSWHRLHLLQHTAIAVLSTEHTSSLSRSIPLHSHSSKTLCTTLITATTTTTATRTGSTCWALTTISIQRPSSPTTRTPHAPSEQRSLSPLPPPPLTLPQVLRQKEHPLPPAPDSLPPLFSPTLKGSSACGTGTQPPSLVVDTQFIYDKDSCSCSS